MISRYNRVQKSNQKSVTKINFQRNSQNNKLKSFINIAILKLKMNVFKHLEIQINQLVKFIIYPIKHIIYMTKLFVLVPFLIYIGGKIIVHS